MTIASASSLALGEKGRGQRAIFSSFAGIAQRLLQIAGVLIIMPMVLHAVGAEGFGVWAAAASLSWMTVVVDFGVGQALLTSIAQNLARGDVAEVRKEIAAGIVVSSMLGLVALVLALTIIPRIASPETSDAYLIAAALLAINIPLNLAGNIWSGLQRFHMTSVWEAFQTIVTVGGLLALTYSSTDTRQYVAVTAGGLALANLLSAINLVLAHPELLPKQWPSFSRCRNLLAKGTPLLLLSISAALAYNLDCVLALSLLGSEAASQMAVAQRACLTAYGLLWVVTQPLWPAFTDAATRGDSAWVRRHVFVGAAAVGICTIAGSAVLLLFGQRLINIWMGGGMTLGMDTLWAMSAWIVLLSLGRIGDVLLNALGATWFQARAAITYSALAFVIKLYLAPSYGIAGILAATALAYGLTYVPAYLWWMTRYMRDPSASSAGLTQ